jgi:hypothetical protein
MAVPKVRPKAGERFEVPETNYGIVADASFEYTLSWFAAFTAVLT